MAYYKDVREYLQALEKNDKLIRVKQPINKDTELHPLVRLQYRGLPEEQRWAFLFEKVVGLKGRAFDIRVAIACYAGNLDIYALGMQCKKNEIYDKWTRAQSHRSDGGQVGAMPRAGHSGR
jgi:UbiD family decarboxylase